MCKVVDIKGSLKFFSRMANKNESLKNIYHNSAMIVMVSFHDRNSSRINNTTFS